MYEDGNKPNQTVTVDISDGEGDTDQIQITLDAGGKGQKDWTVPSGWAVVLLNGPDSAEHTVIVSP